VAIYEYRCKSCDTKFEAMRQMREMNAPAPCPSCQSLETMRLLSLFAAHTAAAGGAKGDGFDAGGCASSAAMGVPCCGGMCGLK
jgi:putative FmdB family regulatory protein